MPNLPTPPAPRPMNSATPTTGCEICGTHPHQRTIQCGGCKAAVYPTCIGMHRAAYAAGEFVCALLAAKIFSPSERLLKDTHHLYLKANRVCVSSQDTYASALHRFVHYATTIAGLPVVVALPPGAHGCIPLPLLRVFLGYASRKFKYNTIRSTLSALADWHKSKGAPTTTVSNREVDQLMASIRTNQGPAGLPQGKEGARRARSAGTVALAPPPHRPIAPPAWARGRGKIPGASASKVPNGGAHPRRPAAAPSLLATHPPCAGGRGVGGAGGKGRAQQGCGGAEPPPVGCRWILGRPPPTHHGPHGPHPPPTTSPPPHPHLTPTSPPPPPQASWSGSSASRECKSPGAKRSTCQRNFRGLAGRWAGGVLEAGLLVLESSKNRTSPMHDLLARDAAWLVVGFFGLGFFGFLARTPYQRASAR
jgi:hypothetical protein